MSNIKHREKFEKMDNQIWKKTKIDEKGRCIIPQKIRRKLGLKRNSSILWISVNHKNGKNNEFLIEVGVKK